MENIFFCTVDSGCGYSVVNLRFPMMAYKNGEFEQANFYLQVIRLKRRPPEISSEELFRIQVTTDMGK